MSSGLASWLDRARAAMPGGVNSPVRAFKAVGGDPLIARRAEGPWIETADGRRYVDLCMSFGPLILGHAHPETVLAIAEAASRGTSFAVTTEAEIELAETLRDAIPSVEKVRLVNSGTEACMTAVRLARAATGRHKILKFSGGYHGHADGMLVRAGSGAAGLAEATSAGVPSAIAAETLVARFNRLDDVRAVVAAHGPDLAGMLLEPVPANVGLLMPDPAFLVGVRDIAASCGAVLVWDEVITGFRFMFGSYQTFSGLDVRPDLVCLGKIIGGGLPVGAVGGRAELMDQLAPLGPVYQAGTLSGNPVAVAAGLATLRVLQRAPPYAELDQRAREYAGRIRAAAAAVGVVAQISQLGSLFSVFFYDRAPTSFEEIPLSQAADFRAMFHALLARGVYLPPSAYEVAFLSAAHTDAVLESTLPAWTAAFEAVAAARRAAGRPPV